MCICVNESESVSLCKKYILYLGAIQKIRVKIGGREGSSHLTRNVTVGEGGGGI